MAKPLALYVPIKPEKQKDAQDICDNFVDVAGPGLSKIGLVHYALVFLIPTADKKLIDAIVLVTSFDGDMETYLDKFWKDDGTKFAFQVLAGLSREEVPNVKTFDGFQRFIVKNNRANDLKLYNAYRYTVADIKRDMPKE
ncbi:MAG TPA: hypothetical protein VN181_11460 [Thermoanaerobaculia bacterium]|nr:hypothetical protein [Thermoanaerobaculia bacterium]